MAELGEGLSGYLDVQDATLRAPRLEAVSNIGIANTAPQHAFSVGSNLYVSTDSSNVLTVDGNVVCEGVKVGLIEIIPSYDLAAVSNVGNVTQSTIQFSNATTGFVTTANVEVGTANLFVDSTTGRVGIGKTDPGSALDVVGDVEISSNLAVSGSKFTYDNINTTVFTGTTSADANEIGYLDMSTATNSNNIHVKVYIKYGKSAVLGDAEYSFYIRPEFANSSSIYDYRNQLGPITPVVYRTDASDLYSGGTPGVVRFGYSIGVAQNVKWRVEVFQRSGNVTFYPTNTGSAVDTTGLVQVTPAPFTRFDSNVAVSGNVGIGTTNPVGVNGTGRLEGSSNGGFEYIATRSQSSIGDGSFIGAYLFKNDDTAGTTPHYAGMAGYGFGANGNMDLRFFAGRDVYEDTPLEPHMTIAKSGNVGIGTTDPACPLHIKFTTNAARSSGTRFEDANSTNYWENWINNGDYFYFAYNGSDRGWIQGPGGPAATKMPNFTGQHMTFIKDIPFNRATECEGLIVSSDQNKYIKMNGGIEAGSNAITTNESLPVVSLSVTTKDKKCFGVISVSEDPETRTVLYGAWGSVAEKEKGDTRVYINSVGEGAIWVTNINGLLESGDYITTSNVAGYGQKQDSEFLANYTVAKITMDCNFEPVTQPVQNIKKEMGDVNYWVKTTYENVTEEEYSNLADENRQIVDGVYQKITKEESKTEQEGYELEVRQELVNVLDEHGQLQWEDDPSGATEKAYKIRYLDASGVETDEENAVHIAAFVGCTYHCG